MNWIEKWGVLPNSSYLLAACAETKGKAKLKTNKQNFFKRVGLFVLEVRLLLYLLKINIEYISKLVGLCFLAALLLIRRPW